MSVNLRLVSVFLSYICLFVLCLYLSLLLNLSD
nr:MAG TPA: hypothetical protein [Inoviridae sp.]